MVNQASSWFLGKGKCVDEKGKMKTIYCFDLLSIYVKMNKNLALAIS
jgi:hypothetical protein